MLIIAIPRSASTSLMRTLGELHHIPYRQIFARSKVEIDISALSVPGEYLPLAGHSDIREYTETEAEYFSHPRKVYKQHIPPTTNNLAVFNNRKKVVLLRDPDDIIESYYRNRVQNWRNFNMTWQDWLKHCARTGITTALRWFYYDWLMADDGKTLYIDFIGVTQNTQGTINRIEHFFGLPKSKTVLLAKERYTRSKSKKNGNNNAITA